ncbi:MAG: hypothetical protein ABSG61_12110 [Gemmatimonadales bacterium]|jgi:hypothetical protein
MPLTRWALALAVAAALAPRLAAQETRWSPLAGIGGDSDERARAAQLIGAPTTGFLLRSASTLTSTLGGDSTHLRWALLVPEVTAISNSTVPFSLNDGALWAGRGWNERVRLGLRAEWGRFYLFLAPEFIASQNLPYPMPDPATEPPQPSGRNPLASPWHLDPSIDAPLRFGYTGFALVDPGQSTFGARLGAVTVGFSTENEWWGPGIQNAIVLSDNAAGIPRIFLRTSRPLHTPIGDVEGSWFLGGLIESRYFDTKASKDWRSISGLAVVLHTAFDPGLSIGLARTVYGPLDTWTQLPGRIFDVLLGSGHRAATPPDTGLVNARDQIFSLFGRWVFPKDHFAVHFEWARTVLPASLSDLLTDPNYSQGYTLGLEWGAPVHGNRDLIRLQAEETYLEESPAYRDRPMASFYTSSSVPQGYTQDGKVIGAAIGQGASGQWLGIDYIAPTWLVGVFAGRIRWDDDALYSFPTPITATDVNKWCSHDASLYGGATASVRSPLGRVSVTVTRGERLNLFFHNLTQCDPNPNQNAILDARNTTLEVRFSP